MSNLSLVLQNIRRSTFGYYSCMALNSEGTTMSNELRLDVKSFNRGVTRFNSCKDAEARRSKAKRPQFTTSACRFINNEGGGLCIGEHNFLDPMAFMGCKMRGWDWKYANRGNCAHALDDMCEFIVEGLDFDPTPFVYTPVCVQKDTTVFGVAMLDTLELTCDVKAHPTDLAFHWRFNSSLALTGDLRSFVSNGTRSILSYTPSGPEDYGTILCFANNAVGRQREACVYHVIPAGPPDRVTNCTQVNRSIDNIYVHCTPGFDGGLEQLFTMELYIYGSHTLVRNLTLTSPKFSVLHLPSATIFEAVIFASNAKGPSIFNRIKVSTLKGPSEKRLATISSGSVK
ncbi:unnamed protein product [Lepeophtheirus salmonis]|uniref:(salmon louse) hypothetical protein n=1 Tax=Lepeophtheirus salmonis TaxID=72036 RepID=A0A7R8D2G4_LEPSM|nr:unnamed protein product [Lepeophtheirus salmonis]CAF3005273.1 unnamed protein product [Lepeophtheirus salmonis]